MKLLLFFAACLVSTAAFAQETPPKKDLTINVPDFASTEAKKFYTKYANHLLMCIEAIRQKDETKANALFKKGEPLVAEEKRLTQRVIKDPAEKKKYLQFAAEAYPYIKELEQSTYYQKLYPQKQGN